MYSGGAEGRGRRQKAEGRNHKPETRNQKPEEVNMAASGLSGSFSAF
jgi:hypothetical protein